MHLAKSIAFIALVVAFVVGAAPRAHAASPLLTEVEVDASTLSSVSGKPFVLRHGTRTWTVPVATLRVWFKTRQLDDGRRMLQLRPGAIYDYLNVNVSPRVNNVGQKSRFRLDDSGNAVLLAGGKKGSIVDGIKTSLAIRAALVSGKSTATVSTKEHRPELFSAADFKKLKFPTLLGRGESSFAGSPRNRIHNITVATQKYNGLVLDAGETFSFNQYLGDVDAANGYLPELVIKENVTTPEFGGGICQVSTTAFRAGMISGLKITARRNHSYPVKYYGTPGFDATVYKPSPDLAFLNDTGKPVLIKTSVVGTRVIFEVWGTSDGRQVIVNGPFVTERKPNGSITAAVAQIVKKNGKSIREENFVSNYQSPDKFPIIRKANGE